MLGSLSNNRTGQTPTRERVRMDEVILDQQLIASARRITTGANIHRIKQLIFAYEQAVSLHNCGWPTHRVYQQEHEIALRQFVTKELQLRFSSNRRRLRPDRVGTARTGRRR